jgi:hypothetical protein
LNTGWTIRKRTHACGIGASFASCREKAGGRRYELRSSATLRGVPHYKAQNRRADSGPVSRPRCCLYPHEWCASSDRFGAQVRKSPVYTWILLVLFLSLTLTSESENWYLLHLSNARTALLLHSQR